MRLAACFFAACAAPIGARAQSSSEALDFTIQQPFVSQRALGMGNAFVGIADDYAAMFYNPAGLARLTESETNLEIRGMIDSGVLSFKSDIEKAADKNTSVADLNQILQSNYGKHYSARIPTVGAYYAHKNWGLAFIPADLSLELGVHQALGPTLAAVATQDSTLAFSYGWDAYWFKHDRISFGITAKAMYREYYNRQFSALDLATDSNLLRVQDAKEGFTADGDIGVMYTPDVGKHAWMGPNFGFAVRNVADYGFTSNFHLVDPKTTGEPARLQRRFDAGVGLGLPDWWVWHSRFAFDVRDMGHDNWTWSKGLHAGVEFNWKVRSWFQGGWRAGLNEGYWTAGFTGRFAIFQLDLVSYGEEVGTSDQPLENRRYMAKCSLDW